MLKISRRRPTVSDSSLNISGFTVNILDSCFLGLLIGSCIQLIFPFLTQSIIDVGINNNDIGFIYLILFAQLALVLGRMSVEFIRGWLLLHIGSRVNVAIVSGFLQKLMSLPVAFFDTKLTGDILQRIEDNNRIEEFLTSASLSILFSFVNLIVFGIVLAIFSIKDIRIVPGRNNSLYPVGFSFHEIKGQARQSSVSGRCLPQIPNSSILSMACRRSSSPRASSARDGIGKIIRHHCSD